MKKYLWPIVFSVALLLPGCSMFKSQVSPAKVQIIADACKPILADVNNLDAELQGLVTDPQKAADLAKLHEIAVKLLTDCINMQQAVASS